MADNPNNSVSSNISNISPPADMNSYESNKGSNHVKATSSKATAGKVDGGSGTLGGNSSSSTKIRIPTAGHKNGAATSSNTKITLRMPPKLKANKEEGHPSNKNGDEDSITTASRNSNTSVSLKLHLKTSSSDKKSHEHEDKNSQTNACKNNTGNEKSVSSNSSASLSNQNSPTHPPAEEKEPSNPAPQEEDEMMEEGDSVLSNIPKKKLGEDSSSSKSAKHNQEESSTPNPPPSSQTSSHQEGDTQMANSSTKSTTSSTTPNSNSNSNNTTGFRGPSLRDGAGMLSSPSFLDNLTEEDRRVRTRHIPSAQGFRKLYKNEIKRDLVLARYFRHPKNKHNNHAAEDDSSDHASTSDANKSNHTNTSSTKSSNSKTFATTDPSGLFLPPIADSIYIYTKDNDDSVTSSTGSSSNKKNDLYLRSPWVVDSMTAHSPPRPPESAGQKKKNRLARWEAHPELVDAELENYRKTVSRTREELGKVEMEKDRIQLLGCHMRNHYREHTKAISEETKQLDQTLQQLLTACLPSSSDTSKSTDELFKEAISAFCLRKRPSQTANSPENPPTSNVQTFSTTPGIGGVSMIESYLSANHEIPLANAWSLPNDKVHTPYGPGTIHHLFGPSKLDVNSPTLSIHTPSPQPQNPVWTPHGFGGASHSNKGTLSTNNSSFGMTHSKNSSTTNKNSTSKPNTVSKDSTRSNDNKNNSKRKKKSNKKSNSNNIGNNKNSDEGNIILLPPRICVKLPFGIGYFAPKDVISKENLSEYSNEQFVIRWKAMMESAQCMKYSMDTVAMNFSFKKKKKNGSDNKMDTETESHIEKSSKKNHNQSSSSSPGKPPNSPLQPDSKSVDHPTENGETKFYNSKQIRDTSNKNSNKQHIDSPINSHRVLPFGSNLMNPSMASWALATMSMQTIENNLKVIPLSPSPNLASEYNHHVPARLHEMENQRLDFYKKKGRVLQLQNEIFRQRRLRMLNERSVAIEEERSERCEILLAEMKADLTILKERLNDELVELGIDQEKAEELLSEQLRLEQEDLEAYNDELLPDSSKQKDDSEDEEEDVGEEDEEDDENNMYPLTAQEERTNHDHEEILEETAERVATNSTHEDRDEDNAESMMIVREGNQNSESNNERPNKRPRDEMDESIVDENDRPLKLRQ